MGSRKASSRTRPRRPHQPHHPKTTIDIYMGLDPMDVQLAIDLWNSGDTIVDSPADKLLTEWLKRGGNVRLLT